MVVNFSKFPIEEGIGPENELRLKSLIIIIKIKKKYLVIKKKFYHYSSFYKIIN